MNTPKIKSFQELQAEVKGLMSPKTASVPAAPEKDERDKGTPAPPTPGGSDPGPQNLPAAQPANTDVTPPNPAPALAPATTVTGTEKVANLASRAKTLAATVTGLMKGATAAGTANVDPKGLPAAAATVKNDGDSAGKGKAAGDAPTATDPRETTPPAVTTDSKGPLPPDTAKNVDKTAGVLEIDPSFAMKVATVVLATEDRCRQVENWMKEEMGAQEATNIIKAAALMNQMAEQSLAEQQDGAAVMDEIWNNASEAERAQLTKAAANYQAASKKLTPEQLAAFEFGMKLAANMMTTGVAGPGAEATMPPEMMDPAGAVSPDNVLAAIELLVAEGVIDEATAQELLASLSGAPDAGGGMPPASPEGAPGMEGAKGGEGAEGGEEDSEDDSPAEKEAKALLKTASALLAEPTAAK